MHNMTSHADTNNSSPKMWQLQHQWKKTMCNIKEKKENKKQETQSLGCTNFPSYFDKRKSLLKQVGNVNKKITFIIIGKREISQKDKQSGDNFISSLGSDLTKLNPKT